MKICITTKMHCDGCVYSTGMPLMLGTWKGPCMCNSEWVISIKLLSCSLSSHHNLPKLMGAQWLHFSCTCLPVSSTELHSICMPSWQFLLFPRNRNTVCYRSVLHCHILFCCRCNGHSPQHNHNTWISWNFLSFLVHEWFPSSSWSSASIQIWF